MPMCSVYHHPPTPKGKGMSVTESTKHFRTKGQRIIAAILKANGESFQGDHGVDPKVCRQVASEILDHLLKQKIYVLIAVRGGNIQGALADLPNVELNIFDYDEFEVAKKDPRGRTEKQANEQWEAAREVLHPIY